jgi:hypothetical protein
MNARLERKLRLFAVIVAAGVLPRLPIRGRADGIDVVGIGAA